VKADTNGPTMSSQHLPDFGGKTVVLYLAQASGSLDGGVALENAEFKWLGERLFVTGRSVGAHGNERHADLDAGVAWDSVHHYLVFSSHADYVKRAAGGRVSLLSRSASG
jgi:hypothetical protein